MSSGARSQFFLSSRHSLLICEASNGFTDMMAVYVSLYTCRVEVSTHMKHQNYGLIFGINTVVALILQTVLTVILTDKRGLAAGARTQVCL